jgi:hypothetical protein
MVAATVELVVEPRTEAVIVAVLPGVYHDWSVVAINAIGLSKAAKVVNTVPVEGTLGFSRTRCQVPAEIFGK